MALNALTGGQIVLIRLKNFMSYDDIELRPGLNLNFIVGPNGTGKSTFVCAVVLGLGGKLKALGRADRLSAYVKTGCQESIIEIELYDPDERNTIIKRKIYTDNRNEFYINGHHASVAKVNEIKVKYNIQLDNLCTFLPQEKVQDFSKLNPQQLLDHTQRTVGTADMIKSYDLLKDLQSQVKDREKESQALEEQIEEEYQRNDRLKDKVKSFLENRALCEKLCVIKQKKAWLFYDSELEKISEVVEDYRLSEEKCTDKKREFEDLLRDIKKMEEYIGSIHEKHSKAKRDLETKKSTLEDEMKKLRRSIEHLEDFDSVTQSKLLEEESKMKEMNQYQETLDKLKNDLHTFESKNGSDEDLRNKEEKLNKELTSNQKEESRVMEIKVNLEDELAQIKNEIKNTSMEYQILERKRNFRLEYIKRYEPDVYQSVEWLEEHKNLFQGRIFNPMLLELDVTDVKYAKYVEARIGYRDLISFTCTNPDDLNLLIQKLRIEQKLKVNAVCSEEDDISQYHPEIPLSQIRSLGFFAYMKDLISGPNHIIRYLCKIYKIHTIPIGNDMVKLKCDRVPPPIQIFFSENQMFSVKVSVYSGDKSINVKQLNEPKLFSISLQNEKVKKVLEREKELIKASGEKETKLKLAAQRLKSLTEVKEQIRQKKRDLVTLQKEKQQILIKIERAEHNIRAVQNTLKDPTAILDETENERKNLRKEISRCIHRVKSVHKSMKKTLMSKQECELRLKVSKIKLNYTLKLKLNCSEQLNLLEETLNTIKIVKDESEAYCSQLKETAKRLTDGFSPGEKGFEKFDKEFRTLKDTLDELETEMHETQVMADFLNGGDAEVLKEYERREKEIGRLNNLLAQSTTMLEEIQSQLSRLREKWVTPITNLVARINESFGNFFESMGCVGEVSLMTGDHKDDFNQYGIVIRVKFRDEIPLQNLGRHFQSGGERAVATAVYLLSLQELMCVPFRFVDEINQGMDSTNERRIIDLMIDVTARENSTQYFFITPKLLPDITCSDTMVTHCIFSGRNAIPSKSWDFKSFLSKADR